MYGACTGVGEMKPMLFSEEMSEADCAEHELHEEAEGGFGEDVI